MSILLLDPFLSFCESIFELPHSDQFNSLKTDLIIAVTSSSSFIGFEVSSFKLYSFIIVFNYTLDHTFPSPKSTLI
jgi:hypothetical protein